MATEMSSATAAPVPPLVVPDVLPVLPTRDLVVFPLAVVPLVIGPGPAQRLVDDAMRAQRLLALVAQSNAAADPAGPGDLYRVGTMAVIRQLLRAPDGTVRLAVQGIERIQLLEFTATEPYLLARVSAQPDVPSAGLEAEAQERATVELFRRLTGLIEGFPTDLLSVVEASDDPRQVAYFVAAVAPLSSVAKQEILALDPVAAKLQRLIELLQHEVAVRTLGQQIASETQERLSKAQREILLREQLRSIQEALGEGAGKPELDDLHRRIEAAGLPGEARQEAERELTRLSAIPDASPEYSLTRTYLDWLASLPWTVLTGGDIDVPRARRVLDEDHYDLDAVKDRILEYLAVRKLRRTRRAAAELAVAAEPADSLGGAGEVSPLPATPEDERAREPILCFVGPPGVGKTSLGQSIARSMGRKFVRMSLGGIRDEAEIRGHRRTYIGALPGRIIQAIRRAETRDPVIMLDELDKVGADWRGDPTAALLEVLDPAQNHSFVDTYLGLPFDLSQVLFIATANTLETIPAPLRDRMEIISLSGYTDEEKARIAQRYLVPRQLAAHGLGDAEIVLAEDAIRRIIRDYTREAGVRDLERQIAAIFRKVARQVAEGAGASPITLTPTNLPDYLGKPRFFEEAAERIDRPGVATGLAWTPVGGEILFVEAAALPAEPQGQRLLLTGMLGDVMRESVQAALTFVLSDAERLGIDPGVFAGKTVHVHVPAGAIPKDGPSAGVAMLSAIASLATNRQVRSDVAMTGEITLRGKVLPIGGVKEKVLAAHRAGIRTIILPRRNERDLDDVPADLRRDLTFILVDSGEQVVAKALCEPEVGATTADRAAGKATSEAPTEYVAEAPRDVVEEAGIESFPASDPPAW
jgi:ATP-dependent Lon protease